jgi:hypothetical protein
MKKYAYHIIKNQSYTPINIGKLYLLRKPNHDELIQSLIDNKLINQTVTKKDVRIRKYGSNGFYVYLNNDYNKPFYELYTIDNNYEDWNEYQE